MKLNSLFMMDLETAKKKRATIRNLITKIFHKIKDLLNDTQTLYLNNKINTAGYFETPVE